MAKSETTIQIMFINRLVWMMPEYADLVFAIPNGGKRDAKTAMILKNMGVRPGVPDVMIAVPRKKYHGLFVELKKVGGRTSGDQERVISALRTQGFMVVVCEGLEAAWEAVMEYLAL